MESRAYSIIVGHGLLIAVASLVWLLCSRAQSQKLWCIALAALWYVESSQTRNQTRVPCIARRILNTGLIGKPPLQYSCLEISMDRGAWQAIVHGVAKSRTWLKWLSIHTGYWFKIFFYIISIWGNKLTFKHYFCCIPHMLICCVSIIIQFKTFYKFTYNLFFDQWMTWKSIAQFLNVWDFSGPSF